jgi:hypothetical protein
MLAMKPSWRASLKYGSLTPELYELIGQREASRDEESAFGTVLPQAVGQQRRDVRHAIGMASGRNLPSAFVRDEIGMLRLRRDSRPVSALVAL